MTGKEIKTAAEKYIDDVIDDTDALTAINEAIRWLGEDAQVYDSTTINAEEGVWANLPPDLLKVVEVNDTEGNIYTQYRTRGNKIILADAGSYTVYYKRFPRVLSSLTETPEVHEAYHSCLVTYLVAWWKLKDDEENPDGLRLMQKFERDALRVTASLRKKGGSKSVKVVR